MCLFNHSSSFCRAFFILTFLPVDLSKYIKSLIWLFSSEIKEFERVQGNNIHYRSSPLPAMLLSMQLRYEQHGRLIFNWWLITTFLFGSMAPADNASIRPCLLSRPKGPCSFLGHMEKKNWINGIKPNGGWLHRLKLPSYNIEMIWKIVPLLPGRISITIQKALKDTKDTVCKIELCL